MAWSVSPLAASACAKIRMMEFSSRNLARARRRKRRLLPTSGMLQRQPSAVLFRARHTLRDEIHPIDAIEHVGVDCVDLLERTAASAFGNVVESGGVDVGQGFEEAFGV